MLTRSSHTSRPTVRSCPYNDISAASHHAHGQRVLLPQYLSSRSESSHLFEEGLATSAVSGNEDRKRQLPLLRHQQDLSLSSKAQIGTREWLGKGGIALFAYTGVVQFVCAGAALHNRGSRKNTGTVEMAMLALDSALCDKLPGSPTCEGCNTSCSNKQSGLAPTIQSEHLISLSSSSAGLLQLPLDSQAPSVPRKIRHS